MGPWARPPRTTKKGASADPPATETVTTIDMIGQHQSDEIIRTTSKSHDTMYYVIQNHILTNHSWEKKMYDEIDHKRMNTLHIVCQVQGTLDYRPIFSMSGIIESEVKQMLNLYTREHAHDAADLSKMLGVEVSKQHNLTEGSHDNLPPLAKGEKSLKKITLESN